MRVLGSPVRGVQELLVMGVYVDQVFHHAPGQLGQEEHLAQHCTGAQTRGHGQQQRQALEGEEEEPC